MTDTPESILEFPCSFPLKVMGKDADDFEAVVIAIIRRHVPNLSDSAITRRPSEGGKYLSITATFTAESREQLDALYRELSSHSQVLMLL